MDTTYALVLSQVVLSLVLPLPMVALVRFTARREVMGEFANTRLTNALAVAATVLLLEIAAQKIPISPAGTTVSLPEAHLTSWRPEPGSPTGNHSYSPTSYLCGTR